MRKVAGVLVKARCQHIDPAVLAAGQMIFGLVPLLIIGMAWEGNPYTQRNGDVEDWNRERGHPFRNLIDRHSTKIRRDSPQKTQKDKRHKRISSSCVFCPFVFFVVNLFLIT